MHGIDLGPAGRLHDAAGVGIERLQVTPLAFVEKDVKRERRFTRAADTGHHIELAARNIDRQTPEVVFLGVDDLNIVGEGRPCFPRLGPRLFDAMHLAHGLLIFTQGLGGVRGRMLAHALGRPLCHQQATGLPALWSEVNQPVGRADHVEVMFDDDQRMAGVEQFAQCAHEFGNVVKMQTRGRFVKQKKRAAPGRPERQRLFAGAGGFAGARQKARELQALGFTARQRRHGLPELDVLQPDIDDGLQCAHHLPVLREQLNGFAHREIKHIGHAEQPGLALNGDLQNLGPVALAVAVRAAQVDVAQELHLDMLEAGPAADRAASVAIVEAELAGGVTALPGQRCLRKQLAHGVPGADIAGRVGARRFADGGLVDKHHVGQVVGAHQPVMQTRRFRGLAELAQQRGRQNVLHQGGLARAAHARHHHQALQRKVHRQVLQVVVACAFQNQPRRVVGDRALQPHADLLARTEVVAGQCVGMPEIFGCAVKHNLAALLAGAGAHVYHSVGRQHHGRVVLDHHQGVAGVAQPVHGLGDAAHVARMQADGRLVEHEQRVDQRGAQRRREVDALHLAARQGTALPVQREVADADIRQIPEPGLDFLKQGLQRLLLRVVADGRHGKTAREFSQTVNRQAHQVMQAQARQGLKLGAAPLRPDRQETLGRRQRRIGGLLGAQAPEQRFKLQACAAAGLAKGVAAVLGQQHTNVHLVGFALEVGKKALDAKPVLIPFAVPVGGAVDDPGLLLGRELVPGRVARNSGHFGVAHQIVLRLLPRRGLHHLDGTGTQRELVVGNHQPVVHADDAAKALAGGACAHRGVEGKKRRRRLGIAGVAVRAMQARGKAPHLFLLAVRRQVFHPGIVTTINRLHIHVQAAAAFQRRLDRLDDTNLFTGVQAQPVSHHIKQLVGPCRRGNFALGMHTRETAGRQPLLKLLGAGVARQFNRKGQDHARIPPLGARHQLGVNRLGRVVPDDLRGLLVEQLGGARIQQLEMVIELRHGAHGGAGGAHRVGLVNRDGRRHAFDLVHGGLVHAVKKLPRIGRESLYIPPLTLREQRIEDQRGFA